MANKPRRYFSEYEKDELDKVAKELNNRPRKTLGFHTPEDKFRSRFYGFRTILYFLCSS